MTKRIMLVFGTRPEAIKMASLYHALKARPDLFITTVCVTAQHRHMLDQALHVFDIKSDIDLNLMREGQDLFDLTSAVMLGMRDVFDNYRPDIVIVHGDTTTTFASAIAGFYAGISIGHIEAGLRTYDLSAPFPEELNRQMVSRIARWHFAPTPISQQNLLNEGVSGAQITVTGNTVIDALFWITNRINSDPLRKQGIEKQLNKTIAFSWQHERFILITGHRRENFGEGFLHICEALKTLALRYRKINFVFPMHLNPNVRDPVNSILAGLSNVYLIEPLDYEPFVYLLKHCYLVLTDSGGIQEEAPSFGKPVLVMRDTTERPEGVDAGTARLVGSNREAIIDNVSELINNEFIYRRMAQAHSPYGDGVACNKIMQVLESV